MAEALRLSGMTAGYGEAVVLTGVDLVLHDGESLALLGRNGMGKTTLVNAVIGLARRFAGTVHLHDRDVTALPPEARALAGIGWVPQERSIFRSLSVEENMTAVARPGRWTPREVYTLFPRLEERRLIPGTQLSGGEQQMLAVGRALVLNPRVLLLDEPLEGLAPIVADELLAALRRIVREEGLATIIVEQNARKILALVDSALVLVRGQVAHSGPAVELREDAGLLERHLGVGSGPPHGTPRSVSRTTSGDSDPTGRESTAGDNVPHDRTREGR
ncbi:MAG: ABC transporter ATP-binding protein [Casimicrobiaceae bacterium]